MAETKSTFEVTKEQFRSVPKAAFEQHHDILERLRDSIDRELAVWSFDPANPPARTGDWCLIGGMLTEWFEARQALDALLTAVPREPPAFELRVLDEFLDLVRQGASCDPVLFNSLGKLLHLQDNWRAAAAARKAP